MLIRSNLAGYSNVSQSVYPPPPPHQLRVQFPLHDLPFQSLCCESGSRRLPVLDSTLHTRLRLCRGKDVRYQGTTKGFDHDRFCRARLLSLQCVKMYMETKTDRKVPRQPLSLIEPNGLRWDKLLPLRWKVLPSILPAGTFAPVLVKAGVFQAFYITHTSATNLNRYLFGFLYGKVHVSNGDLEISRYGYAKHAIYCTRVMHVMGFCFGLGVFCEMHDSMTYYSTIQLKSQLLVVPPLQSTSTLLKYASTHVGLPMVWYAMEHEIRIRSYSSITFEIQPMLYAYVSCRIERTFRILYQSHPFKKKSTLKTV